MPSPRSTQAGHVPALDGVRGLAVLAVMAFHFSIVEGSGRPRTAADSIYYGLADLGWLGVDLFFVLSGYLITGILLRTRESPAYFRSFYARRMLRIFPLYYGFLLVVMVVLPAALSLAGRTIEEVEQITENQWWFWAYLQNIYTFIHGEKPAPGLGHFWSLAIEEQFYLVWPMVVRLCSPRALLRLCLLIILLTLGYRAFLYAEGKDSYAIATFTLTRIDTLATGALLATVVFLGAPVLPALARGALPALAVVVPAVYLLFGPTMESPVVGTIGLTLASLLFACFISRAACPPEPPRRLDGLLAWRPLRRLGQISYGLYVFHVPVRAVLIRIAPDPATVLVGGSQLLWQAGFGAACFLASLILAEVSWRVFESPILRLKRRFPYAAPDARSGAGCEGRG